MMHIYCREKQIRKTKKGIYVGILHTLKRTNTWFGNTRWLHVTAKELYREIMKEEKEEN